MPDRRVHTVSLALSLITFLSLLLLSPAYADKNDKETSKAGKLKRDLAVTSIILSPSSPAVEGTFTAAVTVTNLGTVHGDAGRLDVWLDQPAALPCGTVGDNSFEVGELAAGESRTVTFSGLPAGSPGEKTFSAFVDGGCRTHEYSEANNQSTLQYTVAGPDFVVESIIVDPLIPTVDGMIRVYVTVKNQGPISGDAGRLDVWFDQQAVQPCGAAGDKFVNVGDMAAGWSTTMEFYVQASDTAGYKTLRAYIDSSCGESEQSESNNQSALPYSVLPPGLKLGKVTAAAATSFRIGVVQDTPPPGFEDRFYISESRIDAEPDRAPDNVVTGPVEYVDFTGLTPGRVYFVQAWRHVNGVNVKALRLPDRDGKVSIMNHYHGYTLPESFVPFTGSVWTENWTEPLGVNWYGAPCISIMDVDVRPDDGQMGGAFLRILGHADCEADYHGIPLRSKYVCKPGTPIRVEGTIRFNEDWSSFAWGAVCLYTSEAEYCGFTRQYGQGGAFQFYATGTNYPFPNLTVPVGGRVYRYHYDYDGDRGVTVYLDGVVQGTYTLANPFSAPFGMWLGLDWHGEASVDYGPITITGGDFNVWGFTDNACVMMDLTGATGETGREIRGKNLFTAGGGLTAQEGRGDIMSAPYYELIWNYHTVRYRAGAFTGKSPLIQPATGYKFKDLCLIGSLRAGGSLKAYVRDKNGALIPDDMLPGNSDGFAPTEGAVRTIDISGVQSEGLVIELVGNNPNDWTMAPPIWKAAWVDFQLH